MANRLYLSALHRSALHGSEDVGTRLRIGQITDRHRALEKRVELQVRNASWRERACVTRALSDDAKNDNEIAPMDGLDGRVLCDRMHHVRGFFGFSGQRLGKRKIGGNVNVGRINPESSFECCLSVRKLPRDGLR